ncbi:MAG: peptidase M50 family protein [Anaerolinea thermophila]|uniref:Peptidase M50 family protein n=1 Tax=Anaerolinea thermophila TaxID=167964 RepID=A0A117LGL8_9CHLR|nr:MAG: peptidase M50 family protein [Anaerolinea thermophila]
MIFNLTVPTLISRIITLMIAFTFHEFAHAAVATALGDTTPKVNGRLTLNPMAHLDPMGTITLLFAGFGWAKPVPINPYAVNRKTGAGMMLVSLAGPATNLILGTLAAIPLRFGWVPLTATTSPLLPSAGDFLLEFLFINLALFFFNLLPLAPLDGEKVITYFLPDHWVDVYDRIRPYSPFILLAIVFILPMFGLDLINILIRRPLMDLAFFLIGR